MTLRFLSVCSGIEAASVAFNPLGWEAVGFSEIEKFPCEVLAHHYGSNMPGKPLPKNGIPNFGDFTTIPVGEGSPLGRVDILVGGTPCQAFSVAGKRLSLEDARGNLTLAFTVLAHELVRFHGLRNVFWENVPGVLSTEDNAFGCFLAALVGADDPLCTPDGERWPDFGMVAGPRARAAWRILDAQWFGLAQRRRRVFVVADFGNGADPAAVLFERASVSGNFAPRRETGKRVAGTLSARTKGVGGLGMDFDLDGGLTSVYLGNAEGGAGDVPFLTSSNLGKTVNNQTPLLGVAALAPAITSNPYGDHEAREGLLVAHALTGEGFDASEDGTGRGTPIVPVMCVTGAITHALTIAGRGGNTTEDGTGRGTPIVPVLAHAFDARQSDVIQYGDMTGPLDTDGHTMAVAFSCKDYGADASEDLASTLRSMGHDASHANGGGQLAVAQPYTLAIRGRGDTNNLEYPQDGTANAILTPNGGRAGIGVGAIAAQQQVFSIMPQNSGKDYNDDGRTQEANAYSILRSLRQEIGEEEFAEWGLGISDSFQSSEILRRKVHGGGVRNEAGEGQARLDDSASSRENVCRDRLLSEMWSAGRDRRPPQGRKLSKQLAGKLNQALSFLSHEGTQAKGFMRGLWQASEGLGLLREALSAVQEIRESASHQNQSTHPTWAVRRLTPVECEKLMGFQPGYTAIPRAGKAASECADGPRYKALGNSWAVPCVAWIGRRITEHWPKGSDNPIQAVMEAKP